ncbi:MAG: hypoxanthine phosphoribosyltransferase [Desulfobacteraceae bacterium]|nr:hypoxanthine phosphoribosyltransferase [Desulfobacteraceae bacterium]
MPKLNPVLDKETIALKVAELAHRISHDYKGKNLVLIGVLKGAFVFMADLIRQIDTNQMQIDFIHAASYGSNSESSGSIKLLKDVEVDIGDKHVLIVEDILDSGLTLSYLIKHLKGYNPASIKICAFINKIERRQNDLQPDYAGVTVDKGFLVGYGLDYAEKYRYLPGVYELKFDE